MKKIVLAALAATTAVLATPAAAQVTGTVDVTGTVSNRCSVVLPGGASSATFTGTIALGALDDADGTLRDNLQSSASGTPADNLHVLTRVVCNTAAPVVTISATAMQQGGTLDGTTGYSDTINYTAQVGVTDTASVVQYRRYATLTGLPPAGSVATGAMTLPISAAPGNNVDVSVFNMHAEGADTNILAAGSYLGVVTVTINPT